MNLEPGAINEADPFEIRVPVSLTMVNPPLVCSPMTIDEIKAQSLRRRDRIVGLETSIELKMELIAAQDDLINALKAKIYDMEH